MLSFLPAISVFAFTGCNSTHNQESPQTPPNIIYIMADDLGYADIEPFGQRIIRTPSLQRMAEEGMVFTQHYAGNTVCAPSRCSLMTGKHPGNAYVRGNIQAEPSGQLPLPEGTTTVSGLLNDAGYVTGMIGKWGLGNIGNSGEPSNFGWDYYYGYLDQVLAHNYYPEYLIRNGKKEYLDNEVVYLSDTLWHKGLGSYSIEKNEYSHDLFTRDALRFINENQASPFFLYLPYTIPHDNGEAPEDEKQEVPDFGIYADSTMWNKETRGYASMITRMDRDIGSILDMLDSLGIGEHTLVIFTSDNGPMPGQVFTGYFDSNGLLKGGKRDMYEGGIRVPMIARWTGKIEPGSSTDHISAFWDFLPTACDVAGIETPTGTDGISYLPVLLGDQQESHDYLYWESPLNGFMTAIRMDDWKAVRTDYAGNPDGSFELYNLAEDIGETNNVAAKYPDLIARMDSIFRVAHTPSEHFPMPGEQH